MAKILWDTNLFIYLFERHPRFEARVVSMRQAMKARGDLLYATAMTVGEILVKPAERDDQQVQQQYLRFFRSGAVQILPFDLDAATHYGTIRTDRSIKPPDAIQLACAAAEGIDLFITNDDRLAGKVVAGVNFISALESAPL